MRRELEWVQIRNGVPRAAVGVHRAFADERARLRHDAATSPAQCWRHDPEHAAPLTNGQVLPRTSRRAYLATQGLELLARNVRCKAGEIDLVCRDGRILVFVEVRQRTRAATSAARSPRSRARSGASSFARRASCCTAARLAPLLDALRRRRRCRACRRQPRDRVDQGRVSRLTPRALLDDLELGLLGRRARRTPGLPGALGGASVGSGSASPSGKIMPCPVSRA